MKLSKKQNEMLDQIIDKIETDQELPWTKPYLYNKVSPYNPISKTQYKGFNWIFLSMFGTSELGAYVTYKQAQEAGLQVKKGSKSQPITFFTMLKKEDQKTGKEEAIPCNKVYSVFAVEDLEGDINTLGIKAVEKKDLKSDIHKVDIEVQLSKYIMTLKGGLQHVDRTRAYYTPSEDYINMPRPEDMRHDSYYQTLCHEAIHSTGHDTRLNRKLASFNCSRNTYSFEELIAEIGSCFLAVELGLKPNIENSSAYVKGWLKYLRGDKDKLISAANKANKACEFITTMI
jgi:antirestriction protein ArdC